MRLLIAGDFCPQQRVTGLFEEGNFQEVLDEAKEIIKGAEYSIVNFESSITTGCERPITKSGPNLHCSKKGVEALKWAGFKGVTLANNHVLDYGSLGLANVISTCNQYEVDYVGAGDNLKKAERVLYKNINGEKLAIINCCEHEFSIATDTTPGCNPLNPIQQYYSIKEAREKADYVVVIVHGGHEHFQYPSIRMKQTYRFFVDAGADAVVNHHQHCFSGYEIYKEKPIFYGIGNFCFDNGKKEKTKWHYGYMIELLLKKEIGFVIHPYENCLERPVVKMLGKDVFNEEISKINKVIENEEELDRIVKNYYNSSILAIKMALAPIGNRIIDALLYRKWLPIILPKKWLLRLENYTLCESHRDKLSHFFLYFHNANR